MYADLVVAGSKRSIKERLNGNFGDDLGRNHSGILKRQRQNDDKWEHDLYDDKEPQTSKSTVGPKDLRLKLQKKGLRQAYPKGMHLGVRDLREKLSGTMHSQPPNTNIPKARPVMESAKPVKKSAPSVETSIPETKKIANPTSSQKKSQQKIHGLLNAVGWGILLPIGGMAARWLKKFNPESPTWFYIHVPCQLIGYAAGLAGGATGLKLGSDSEGVTYTTHRDIAIALICIGVLQVSALFLRPDKSHKYRKYWNAYHHLGGYAVIVLGVINVLKGLQMLNPDRRFVMAYVVIISILAIVSVLLEISSRIFVGMSKNSRKTADGTGVAVEQSAYQHHEPLAA